MTHDEPLYLETLAEFACTLVASYDVSTVLADLTHRLTKVLDLIGCGVTLAKDGRLEYVTGVPEKIAALEREQVETQLGPCVTAYQTGETVAVEDLQDRADQWPSFVALAQRLGVRATAGIPMHLEGESVGAIDLYSVSPRAWTDRDLAAATVMANMATAYLLNASLYDRQRRLAEQLKTALESRIVIEQAKGVLANEHSISVDDAFERLRRHARTHGASVRAVAEAVVTVGLRPD
ncbi:MULTISPECIES: GAF and ANTAR domain-containing protein [Nocardioides]|uniref:ANTAR domain-containing protein n=1 Tax=Nocardioides vastitatis TaxID=2568655 RepID=A0ABW0ZE55_9ACTN|nr:GAF and ANTAR domain-containing protein [Nocardioides sp.]THI90848.1 GAF and ANTAR domain-containing protein [Nocardioides sp.]